MLEELEDAIAARLVATVGTTNADISVLPDDTSTLKQPAGKAIIYVVISQCGNMDDNDTSVVATFMDVHVEVSIRSAKRRGAGGLYALEEASRAALSGYRINTGGFIDPIKFLGSKTYRAADSAVEGISLIFMAKVAIFDANYSEGVQYGNLAQVVLNKEFL